MTNLEKNESVESLDFSTFVLSVASAAFMGLGLAPQPKSHEQEQDRFEVDLFLARHNIDLLEMLQKKTKGNLSVEESKLLDHLLYEARLKFVEVSKK